MAWYNCNACSVRPVRPSRTILFSKCLFDLYIDNSSISCSGDGVCIVAAAVVIVFCILEIFLSDGLW